MGTGPSGASERTNAGGESGSVRQSEDEGRAGQRADGRSMGSSLRGKGEDMWVGGEGTKQQGWAEGTLGARRRESASSDSDRRTPDPSLNPFLTRFTDSP